MVACLDPTSVQLVALEHSMDRITKGIVLSCPAERGLPSYVGAEFGPLHLGAGTGAD